MPATSAARTTALVKRACDSCHRRKVKCLAEGANPCKNCIMVGLNCTYKAIPQKKGPKGSRAKVLSELRKSQQHPQPSDEQHRSQLAPNQSAAFAHGAGLVPPDILKTCVDYYFDQLHPMQPILDPGEIHRLAKIMGDDVDAFCTVVSFCASVLLQSNTILEPHAGQASNIASTDTYLDAVLRVRNGYKFTETPTIYTVQTSFFISSCYLCLRHQNTAWFYLQQATTLAHILGLHDESTYENDDRTASSRKRRLFWLLFMAERAYALDSHRPLTLYDTICVPKSDDDHTEIDQLTSFLRLIKFYTPIDESLCRLEQQVNYGKTPPWLIQLEEQFCEALPNYIQATQPKPLDFKTSQRLLKSMIWYLVLHFDLISSRTSDYNLGSHKPFEVSVELAKMSAEFPKHAIEAQGSILVKKMIDIVLVLVDIMAYARPPSTPYQCGALDFLNLFIHLIPPSRGDPLCCPLPAAISPFGGASPTVRNYYPPDIHTPNLAGFGPLPSNVGAFGNSIRFQDDRCFNI